MVGGIHYEKITASEIETCLELCLQLAKNLAEFLKTRQPPCQNASEIVAILNTP